MASTALCTCVSYWSQTPWVALKGTLPPLGLYRVLWHLQGPWFFPIKWPYMPLGICLCGFPQPPVHRTHRQQTSTSVENLQGPEAQLWASGTQHSEPPHPTVQFGSTRARARKAVRQQAGHRGAAACPHPYKPTWVPIYWSASAQRPGEEAKGLPYFKQFQRSVPSKCWRLPHMRGEKHAAIHSSPMSTFRSQL